jgi:hypothetical protein
VVDRVSKIAALLLLAASGSALGADIKPTLDVSALRVEVMRVASERAIEQAAQRYGVGGRSGTPGISQRLDEPTGFSVLVRVDGALVCKLYVVKPERVDDKYTLILGHELAHCLLGAYH